ncbi:MBL fold metallo-hydrolase [Eubacterium barkeri]|uniref:Ribonuclease BN, tRNA processing enzyme n=1 Tax=Eubacterium barkeri TaxID=1528 RepID=A0A1H3EM34_EUBBA|nr:MBL fold metallo-hydrolase [Eubacterium barkeri]SDX78999.1 Ribonuclease BN, tRNA processing enzyme [Eubacterium barkeri]
MKLTVLGNSGGYPRPGGACSGYLLEEGDVKIVLDMGAGTLANLLTHCDLEKVTAIICTHLHSDHISDLFVLRYALEMKGLSLPIYLPPNPEEVFNQLSDCAGFEVTPITEGMALDMGGLHLTFSEMSHPYPDFAVKATDGKWVFMYTGDTCLCDAFVAFAQGVHVLLCDCTFLGDGHSDKHLSLGEAIEVANGAGVRHLIMTHFDPTKRLQDYYREANDRFIGRASKAEISAKFNL